MQKRIEELATAINEYISQGKEIYIISHFDTDGITSATIMLKTLKELDARFSIKIIKSLEEKTIKKIPKDKKVLFLDLASGSIDYLERSSLEKILVIDHHEIPSKNKELPPKIMMLNPQCEEKTQSISSAGLTYVVCKELLKMHQKEEYHKELAKLAIVGMIGDSLEKNIDKLNSQILTEGEITKKRGLLFYPSTRPVNRVLEYHAHPMIPGVTGNPEGVTELLRDALLTPQNGRYKSIIELEEEEMKQLVTAILLRLPQHKQEEIIGDIFLIKFFNKLEDARELSATINACSRFGHPEVALQFCLERPDAKKQAEMLHTKNKRQIISGIEYLVNAPKISGEGFVIANAKDMISETIIGTICSIMANSGTYQLGTVIVTLAYFSDKGENKAKISARVVGKTGRNVRELLEKTINEIGGEVGGHQAAAGGIIKEELVETFLNNIKKNLEVEVVKVQAPPSQNA